MADETKIEEKPTGWKHILEMVQLKGKIWQLILVLILVLAIIVGINFALNSYLAYRQEKSNSELNRQLEESQQKLTELSKLTGESLARLSESKNLAAVETAKREAAEKILIEDGKNSAEKSVEYEKAKLAIIVDKTDMSTEELCAKAAKFGISCLENK